ncbi:pseudouridylate synthase 4 [Mycena floridula]|nr:pseudouridylate synthase 4 [Mycena floridula]
MPKITLPSLPISGLFGVAKPSGPTSMSVVSDIQELVARSKLFVGSEKLAKMESDVAKGKKMNGKRLRELVKVGQGGTLDPLADGVLVVAVGKGTKQLSKFLDCTKEYRTTCLLGCETDSYDSEGAIVRHAPWKHVTPEDVKSKLAQFTGSIQQTPPIFSALKMDGMPLYEYARKGIPLPRPIEARPVTVHNLEMVEWLGSEHEFVWPHKELSQEEKQKLAKAAKLEITTSTAAVDSSQSSAGSTSSTLNDTAELPSNPASPKTGSAFVLKMTVSGGTYVRSIVHDLAHSLGSAGHVVTLTRTRQGEYVLEGEPVAEGEFECISWDTFQQAKEAREAGNPPPTQSEDDEWTNWENEVISKVQVVS